jgi:hypothetical protein
MKQKGPEELEELLRERSEQYLLYPSDKVWGNINKELHPNRSWIYISLIMLIFIGSTTMVMLNKKERSSWVRNGAIISMHPFAIPTPSEKLLLPSENQIDIQKGVIPPVQRSMSVASSKELTSVAAPQISIFHQHEETPKDLVVPFSNEIIRSEISVATTLPLISESSADKKSMLATAVDNIIVQAKKIGKNAKWQFYATPTIGYRRLEGKASSLAYNYSSYSLSTNAMFARDVNDAVSHRPGMGFEVGAVMYYPLTKRLSLKTGLQANYNHYQIDAYASVPEIANYGVNNLYFGGVPISAVSTYSNSNGYSTATLRNEHYMISIPVGLDYRVAGTKKLNFSVASTIQPTYVFANYSYLISTNLRNYAKEPSLNRNWNINSSVEANVNFEKGDYKWSVGPQFRYQLFSSFKDKYPISENLMDFGIKVGVIKTLK